MSPLIKMKRVRLIKEYPIKGVSKVGDCFSMPESSYPSYLRQGIVCPCTCTLPDPQEEEEEEEEEDNDDHNHDHDDDQYDEPVGSLIETDQYIWESEE